MHRMLCRARPCTGVICLRGQMLTSTACVPRNCSLSNACVWSGLGQQGMAAQIYDIRAIPNTLLIDPKGNIVGKGMTHEQIEALLNK